MTAMKIRFAYPDLTVCRASGGGTLVYGVYSHFQGLDILRCIGVTGTLTSKFQGIHEYYVNSRGEEVAYFTDVMKCLHILEKPRRTQAC